ncbi:MAG: hypothetical protein MUP67_01905 [Acidimicrobiia bacterium]|nr:hypothetical protein [Acidimicrobiia bacterium]
MRIDETDQETFASWIREQARVEPRTLRTQRRSRPEDLRCHPDLCERLRVTLVDLPGAKQRYLCGFPVLLHGDGLVFAVAAGTSWLALRLPPIATGAVMHTRWGTRGLGDDWTDVDPWLADIPARDGTRRLRGWCHAAYEYTAPGIPDSSVTRRG